MQEGYSRSLYVVLDHWKLTLTVLLLVVAANVWMYIVVPKGFFPQQDTGVIMGGIRADQSASFQDMEVKLARLVRILSADPAVDQVSAHISAVAAAGGRVHLPQAAGGTRHQRPAGHRPPARQDVLGTGAADLFAGRAGHHDGRAQLPFPVPVYPAGR